MSSTDLRVIKTKEAIEREFLSCLKIMPFRKITVSLLITRCRINRTTFYRNYEDIYDLVNRVVEKYAALFQYAIPENASVLNYSNASVQNMNVKQFATICKDNRDRLLLLWNSDLPVNLYNKISDIISTYMFSSICKTYNISKEQEKRGYLYANLFAAHAMAVLRWWLTECPELSIEEVATIINRNAENGFLYSVVEEFEKQQPESANRKQ